MPSSISDRIVSLRHADVARDFLFLFLFGFDHKSSWVVGVEGVCSNIPVMRKDQKAYGPKSLPSVQGVVFWMLCCTMVARPRWVFGVRVFAVRSR